MLGSRLVKQVGVDHADLVNQQHIGEKPPIPDLRMWTAHSTRERHKCYNFPAMRRAPIPFTGETAFLKGEAASPWTKTKETTAEPSLTDF